jgi:hypothetical protein
MKSALKSNEVEDDFDFLIDIHRDAISSDYNFKPTAQINGESVSKLMFVIGTNSAGVGEICCLVYSFIWGLKCIRHCRMYGLQLYLNTKLLSTFSFEWSKEKV